MFVTLGFKDVLPSVISPPSPALGFFQSFVLLCWWSQYDFGLLQRAIIIIIIIIIFGLLLLFF